MFVICASAASPWNTSNACLQYRRRLFVLILPTADLPRLKMMLLQPLLVTYTFRVRVPGCRLAALDGPRAADWCFPVIRTRAAAAGATQHQRRSAALPANPRWGPERGALGLCDRRRPGWCAVLPQKPTMTPRHRDGQSPENSKHNILLGVQERWPRNTDSDQLGAQGRFSTTNQTTGGV